MFLALTLGLLAECAFGLFTAFRLFALRTLCAFEGFTALAFGLFTLRALVLLALGAFDGFEALAFGLLE